jgi:vacuolar-type H+-ATPase subunit F/Vma7
MSAIEFIGDEISAAGYRLCGVEVHIADSANTAALIQQACKRASLVLVGSSTAACLGTTELETLLANVMPPVLLVPDVAGRQRVPDLAGLIHRHLGMLE